MLTEHRAEEGQSELPQALRPHAELFNNFANTHGLNFSQGGSLMVSTPPNMDPFDEPTEYFIELGLDPKNKNPKPVLTIYVFQDESSALRRSLTEKREWPELPDKQQLALQTALRFVRKLQLPAALTTVSRASWTATPANA